MDVKDTTAARPTGTKKAKAIKRSDEQVGAAALIKAAALAQLAVTQEQ